MTKPVSPVSAARSGRTAGRGMNCASSRLSRGRSPARRNDDLPAPEAPRIASSRGGAPALKPAKPSRKRRCVHLTQPSKPDPTLSSLNRLRNKSVLICLESARAAASGDWKHEFDLARVDLLMAGNADRPGKAARAQRLTELGAHAIAGVGENRSEANAGGDQTIQFGRATCDLVRGPPGLSPPAATGRCESRSAARPRAAYASRRERTPTGAFARPRRRARRRARHRRGREAPNASAGRRCRAAHCPIPRRNWRAAPKRR